MEKEISEPAFPTNDVCYNGMTLRDYFAAKAMQAIIGRSDSRFTTTPASVCDKAYQYADTMMEARK